MILLGPGARLAGVCALNVESTCVAIVLVFVAFDGMFCIGTSAAVVVVVVVVAIVVVAIVVVPVLLAVELNGLHRLSLHGGCTIWHHWHHLWLLLRGGCELDLLGGDGLLHLSHVCLHPCEHCLHLIASCDGPICRLAECQ